MLIAEDEKMVISAIKSSENFVEFRDASFGWNAQPEATAENGKSGNHYTKPLTVKLLTINQ